MRGFVAPSVVYRTRGSKVRTYSRTKALACLHLRTSLLDPRIDCLLRTQPATLERERDGQTLHSSCWSHHLYGLTASAYGCDDLWWSRSHLLNFLSFDSLSLSLQVPNHVEGKTRSAEACLPICSVAASARRVLLPRAVFGCVGDRKGHAVWEQGKRITEAVDQLAS